MATGKKLIQNVRSSGWAKYRYRGENVERHYQSDRMKGVGKVLNRQLRSQLKRELKQELEMEL